MKGKLKYFTKSEDVPNSVEGWSISPIRDEMTSQSYNITEESLFHTLECDKEKEYEVDYELQTNCRIDEDGYHSHHSVIAKIIELK